LSAAAVVSGAAMLVKHTAIILPFVAVVYAVLWCLFRSAPGESAGQWIGARWKHAVVAPVIAFAALTFFSGGFSPLDPPHRISKAAAARAATQAAALAERATTRPELLDDLPDSAVVRGGWQTWPIPAGSYFRSLRTASHH